MILTLSFLNSNQAAKQQGNSKMPAAAITSVLFAELSKLIADSLVEHFMAGDPATLHYRALGIAEVVVPMSRWQMLPKR